MKKIRDRLLLGMLAGVGANLVKEAVAEAAFRLGIAKYTCRRMAPYLFLNRRQARTWKGQVIGTTTDMAVAALTGIFITYTLTLTGSDHKYLKGIVVGNGVLDQVFGVFSRAVPGVMAHANSNLLCRGIHTLFGVTAAWLTTTLGHPALFQRDWKQQHKDRASFTYTFQRRPSEAAAAESDAAADHNRDLVTRL